jgi:hypothetical protein
MQTSRRLDFIFALFTTIHGWARMTQTPGTRDAPLNSKGTGLARLTRPTLSAFGQGIIASWLGHEQPQLPLPVPCY